MAEQTAIEWTDSTWNIVTGCTRVSPGCANCYIERTPPFRMAGRRFATVGAASTTGVRLHPDRLEQPLHWRKPRRVFVCSLADLFHDDVPDEFIGRVWAAMALAPTHTFQVLTKRPERALSWMSWALDGGIADIVADWGYDEAWPGQYDFTHRPLPNVWVGVSIENARYTWRADVLREIPAAVRFISAEPLLGSLFEASRVPGAGEGDGAARDAMQKDANGTGHRRAPLALHGIDWVIVGGESGPGARPFHLEHAREIIRAARYMRSEVFVDGELLRHSAPSIFVKQLGAKPTGRAGITFNLRDKKGGDWDEWPADLRIREFPRSVA